MQFRLHPIKGKVGQGQSQLYALLTNDLAVGGFVGDEATLRALGEATRPWKPAEAVRPDDPRLESWWLDVAEATRLARQVGQPRAAVTIRSAARAGRIPGAARLEPERDWRLPRWTFLWWLHHGDRRRAVKTRSPREK